MNHLKQRTNSCRMWTSLLKGVLLDFEREVGGDCTAMSVTAIKFCKSNVHYIRGITLKRVTSGGIHLSSFAPEQHSSEETSQRRQPVGDTVSDLIGPEIEPQTSRTDSGVFNNFANHKTFAYLRRWIPTLVTRGDGSRHTLHASLSCRKYNEDFISLMFYSFAKETDSFC